MALDRRSFLQRLGLTLFSFGIVDRYFSQDLGRYASALGRFTGQKFALLIGIDEYPDVADLSGCNQDLQLQKSLLIRDFGFKAGNIIALSDGLATREEIFSSFQKRLKDLIQPNDFLLVHFSGYGTQIKAADGDLIPAIMPVDGLQGKSAAMINNAIALSTVEGLMRSLNPAQMALVLDTNFTPGPAVKSSSSSVRAYPQQLEIALNPSELAIREQLQRNLSQRKLLKKSIVTLRADQLGGSQEVSFNGAGVGLLTATLVRYLSSINPQAASREVAIALAEELTGETKSPAVAAVKSLAPIKSSPALGIMPDEIALPAIGHVAGVEGNEVTVCLSGLSPEILQAIAPGSVLENASQPSQALRITGQNGIFAKAKMVKATEELPTIDNSIQENERVIPRALTLQIAFGRNLSRIERVDATSAFAGIVGIADISPPGEWVDYIFDAGYELFSLKGESLPGIPPVEVTEAIKSSVDRLESSLERLLALKWLRLLGNESSSTLPVEVTLNRLQPKRTVEQKKATPLSFGRSPKIQPVSIKSGETLVFQFKNTGDKPLNFVGFAQTPKQELILLTPQNTLSIYPGQTESPEIALLSSRPYGHWKVFWIGSDRPLTEFQEQLDKQFSELEATTVKLEEPLSLVRSLLAELSESTTNSENYRFSTDHWVNLSFTYDVIDPA